MKNSHKIEKIRCAIQDAKGEKETAVLYAELFSHPELTWIDLINILESKVLMGEQAAFKLHSLLDVDISEVGPILDQNEWHKILKDRKIEPTDLVQEKKKSKRIAVLMLILLICCLVIIIAPLPIWYIGSRISDKIKYWHILMFMILFGAGCVSFWCSEIIETKRRLFRVLGNIVSISIISLLVFYLYHIFFTAIP